MKPVITIDFGGTTIKIAIVQNGEVIKKCQIPAWSENGLKARLADTVEAVCSIAGHDFSLYDGIGIAMPGLIDSQTKRVSEIYEKYEDSLEMDLEKWCREEFGLSMVIEQDSKAALLGEVYFGCAQGAQDVLMLTLGTGLGTAVMLNGKLLDSRNHFAGALGSHIIIDRKNGRQCTCGNRGCLEAHTASYALPGMVKEHEQYLQSGLCKETKINYYVLKKWYEQNDIVAKDVLQDIIVSLRVGMVSLIHCYDPSVVILSGGALNFGKSFLDPLLVGIEDELWGKAKVEFRVASNPDESVLLGLYRLVQLELEKNLDN